MKCRICAAEGEFSEYVVKEMLVGFRDEHRYFECSACGCLQITTEPADLDKYYHDAYYSYQPVELKPLLRRLMLRPRNQYALWGSGLIGRLLFERFPTPEFEFLKPIAQDLTLKSRIIDVGCGSGILLHILYEGGFRNLLGVDPFIVKDMVYSNGLTIRKTYIHDVTGEYDLIMYHHSYEHAWDAQAVLRSTLRLLRKGGWCIIALPTVSSYAWKHYGVDWVQLDAPRHFYLHSRKSMNQLARDTGFEVVRMTDDSHALQFWGSEQYRQGITMSDERSWGRNPDKSIFTSADIAAFTERAKQLNAEGQGDQVIFYLRRP